VSGAIPLAFAAGAGAESRQEIGWVIVGGMTFGTLLTLFVVPTAYTFLARDRSRSAALEATPAAPVRQAAE
jgi:multidrug efflux pump